MSAVFLGVQCVASHERAGELAGGVFVEEALGNGEFAIKREGFGKVFTVGGEGGEPGVEVAGQFNGQTRLTMSLIAP